MVQVFRPIPLIFFASRSSEYPESFSFSIGPLSLISVSISIEKLPLPIWQIRAVIPLVSVAILKLLLADPMLHIVEPLSRISAPIFLFNGPPLFESVRMDF